MWVYLTLHCRVAFWVLIYTFYILCKSITDQLPCCLQSQVKFVSLLWQTVKLENPCYCSCATLQMGTVCFTRFPQCCYNNQLCWCCLQLLNYLFVYCSKIKCASVIIKLRLSWTFWYERLGYCELASTLKGEIKKICKMEKMPSDHLHEKHKGEIWTYVCGDILRQGENTHTERWLL